MSQGESIGPEAGKQRAWLKRVWPRILLAAAVLTPLIVWRGDLTDHFLAKKWGVVVPARIYRSGQNRMWVIEDLLRRHGIHAIVDLQGVDPSSPHQAVELEVGEKLGLEQHRFGMRGDGTTNDIGNYAGAIAVLDRCEKAGTPVLVHCGAGAHRTGGVVACYRVLVQGMTTDTAVAEMMQYSWHPERHHVLLDFLNENLPELAQRLVAEGVLERVPDPLPIFRAPSVRVAGRE